MSLVYNKYKLKKIPRKKDTINPPITLRNIKL